jgi:hypothetical protein
VKNANVKGRAKMTTQPDKDQKRRFFQWIKSTTVEKFWKKLNQMHTDAYMLAEEHYRQAMYIELEPRLAAAVKAKADEIRTSWDDINDVVIDLTVHSESEFAAFIRDNLKVMTKDKMIELIMKESK